MKKKQKIRILRIAVSALALIVLRVLSFPDAVPVWCIYGVVYLIAGYDVLWSAARGIVRGNVFDEKFLMTIATIGAFAIGNYPEAVFVMMFFQVGELFESIAVDKSRRNIAALMDIRPESANLERDGELVETDPEEVGVGDVIVVKPGERIPLDGVVLTGESDLDTAALTGESVPRMVVAGDTVISGCVNLCGVLRVKVTKRFEDSTVSNILALVESATERKSRSETFINRFASWYTPAVCAGALMLAVIPGFITGMWTKWLHRALVFLVVSCPCALVISVPLSYFGGIGGASKKGILIKGSSYMDSLANAETVVFDKTGTLTEGVFSVHEVTPYGCDPAYLMETAALAETYSDHPAAYAVKTAWGKNAETGRVSGSEELPGRGVRAVVDGKTILVGNLKLMKEADVPCETETGVRGTVLYVAENGRYLGRIVISDRVKTGAGAVLETLRTMGIQKIVMLTGDRHEAGADLAEELGIDEVKTELLPMDKITEVERLLQEKSSKGNLVYVGDGINDAPVLARADVGVAMGALGSDAAIEAADLVLMDDQLAKIAEAVRLSRRTRRIARQNIIFALGVKLLVLVLAIPGFAGMWLASFADVGVCVIAVLNAMRAMK